MSDLSLPETIFEIIDTCDIKILADGDSTAKRCEHKMEAVRKALRAVADAVDAHFTLGNYQHPNTEFNSFIDGVRQAHTLIAGWLRTQAEGKEE